MKVCTCQSADNTPATEHRPKSQSELAWALAKAVEDRLNPIGRAKMYAALGAGETFQTIAVVLRIALHGRVPLAAELIDDIGHWLDGYTGTDDEADLRNLVNDLRALRASPMARSQVTTPNPIRHLLIDVGAHGR
jgi:hypothetical protein